MIAGSITMRSMTGHGNRAADHGPTRNPGIGTVVITWAGIWCAAAPSRVTHVTGTQVTLTGAQELSGPAGVASRRNTG